MWKDEFRTARHMTIEEMNTWAHAPTPISGTVCVHNLVQLAGKTSLPIAYHCHVLSCIQLIVPLESS